jgi:hypothetical protein
MDSKFLIAIELFYEKRDSNHSNGFSLLLELLRSQSIHFPLKSNLNIVRFRGIPSPQWGTRL